MKFETFYRSISYAAVFCGFMALWVSGTFGPLGTVLFTGVLVVGWLIEDTRWQISERIGTALIVLALPAFYLAWRMQLFTFASSETMVAGILARLILTLAAIKILQRKSDRDWIFLYLMSFFEVLLAAGLSISALYLGSLIVYLLVTACAIVAYEMRKTTRAVSAKIDVGKNRAGLKGDERLAALPLRRLPATSVVLIVFVIALAAPLFFLLPRVGGAGLGSQNSGLSTSTGFSDTVQLGGIGRIQQNDAVVMRIRLEADAADSGPLYWRGIFLDTFDNRSWSKSRRRSDEPLPRGEREFIQVDYATGRDTLLTQTIYLEPIDSPVLFGLARPVAIQGNFPYIMRDGYGSLSSPKAGFERTSYKVISDTAQPAVLRLVRDNAAYSAQSENYLQLPESLDGRIGELAGQITAGQNSRYGKAKAVESYLQNNFGYTLEMKAQGPEPLADFLFNVREGHCEYFATSMAVMLRTQGIATRVVNGFQQGEYNDTADVYVVRQANAHSWVEVYFPGENAWVRFDPTPFAGQPVAFASNGMSGTIGKYIEALETFWIQYFVAFDNQEQRSLFRSMRNGFIKQQAEVSSVFADYRERFAEWWREVRGDQGLATSLRAVGMGALYLAAAICGVLLLVFLYRKIKGLSFWQKVFKGLQRRSDTTVVEFYERMQRLLASKDIRRPMHQTPLEFATALGMSEAVKITEKYNLVRFGEKELTREETIEIESALERIDERITR